MSSASERDSFMRNVTAGVWSKRFEPLLNGGPVAGLQCRYAME